MSNGDEKRVLFGQQNESDSLEKASRQSISMPVQPFYQWLNEKGSLGEGERMRTR